jgi:micrococcal nuclease
LIVPHTPRWVGMAAVIVFAAAILAAPQHSAGGSGAHASATCSDYSTQREAQLKKDTRDADGDGIYCESLPCPCLKPGQGEGGGSDPSKPGKRKRAQRIRARITSVVDGDTVKVRAFDARRDFYTVRLIGIDTPETKRPGRPIECGGKQATSNMLTLAFTAPRDTDGDALMDAGGGKGRRVTLTTDPTQDTFDRYRRLLAYVVTRSGTHLQIDQLTRGWAKVYVFERRFRQHRRFRRARSAARAASHGVWSKCGGNFHRPAS